MFRIQLVSDDKYITDLLLSLVVTEFRKQLSAQLQAGVHGPVLTRCDQGPWFFLLHCVVLKRN